MSERLSMRGRWRANRLARRVVDLGGTPADVALAVENFEDWVAMDNAVAGLCTDARSGVGGEEMERRSRARAAERQRKHRASMAAEAAD